MVPADKKAFPGKEEAAGNGVLLREGLCMPGDTERFPLIPAETSAPTKKEDSLRVCTTAQVDRGQEGCEFLIRTETSSRVFFSFSISSWWMFPFPTHFMPRASIHFRKTSAVCPGLPPCVQNAVAFFPSHPFSASIAAWIAGVGLNAQTGDPNTSRS